MEQRATDDGLKGNILCVLSVCPDITVEALSGMFKESEERIERLYNEVILGSIDDLFLTVRSHNALLLGGVKTVKELIQLTKEDLQGFKQLGRKSLRDIIEQLEAKKLNLKGNSPFLK